MIRLTGNERTVEWCHYSLSPPPLYITRSIMWITFSIIIYSSNYVVFQQYIKKNNFFSVIIHRFLGRQSCFFINTCIIFLIKAHAICLFCFTFTNISLAGSRVFKCCCKDISQWEMLWSWKNLEWTELL